jgi:hypothetical protein
MSIAALRPRPYDLDNPVEVKRLLRECLGYLRTCKRHHHGTDFEGREFAMEALNALADRYPQERATPVENIDESQS